MFPTFAVFAASCIVCYGLLKVADAIKHFSVEHRLPDKAVIEKSRDGFEYTVKIQ